MLVHKTYFILSCVNLCLNHNTIYSLPYQDNELFAGFCAEMLTSDHYPVLKTTVNMNVMTTAIMKIIFG
jgi:hypothetical protein